MKYSEPACCLFEAEFLFVYSLTLMMEVIFSSEILVDFHRTKLKTKLHGLSPQANYTDRLSDRRLSAKLVPTLADIGCCVVSATIPPQSLFRFSRPEPLFL
jgi:hypothetical protein